MSVLKRSAPSAHSYGDRSVLGCILMAALAAAAASGCATPHSTMRADASTSSTDLYHVGPLRVLLRPQPEVEFMCRLHTQQQATPTGRILGCYVPREKAIISTPDPHVLLHEFKHYFEGTFHD